MINYKIFSIVTIFIISSTLLNAQTSDTRPAYVVGSSINGPSLSLNYIYQNVNIKGSPFLNNQWQLANLVSKNGTIYKLINVKFDVYNQKFIFNRNDSLFEIPDFISEVRISANPNDTLSKVIFKKGALQSNQNAFLQLLVEGKYSLLKYVKKEIEEITEYGTATKVQQYVDIEQYYFSDNGIITLTSISKKNFDKFLKQKSLQLDSYIKEKSLSGKELKDWVSAITFLNSNK